MPEQPIKKLKSSADHTHFNEEAAEKVKEKVEVQGEKVRTLKASGTSKVGSHHSDIIQLHHHDIIQLHRYDIIQEVIDAEVATLLSLKAQYKSLTGNDLVSGPGKRKPEKERKEKEKKEKKEKAKKKEKKPAESVVKEAEGEGARKKQTRFATYFVTLTSPSATQTGAGV